MGKKSGLSSYSKKNQEQDMFYELNSELYDYKDMDDNRIKEVHVLR